MTQNPWGQRFYDHYVAFLREPIGSQTFSQSVHDPSIQVLAFERVFKGCMFFASLGLSHYATEVGQVGECCIASDDAWPVIPKILANSLFYLAQHRMPLGRGVAVGGIATVEPEFVRRFSKSAIYFTTPFNLPNEFATVEGPANNANVYMGLFITKAEQDFFAAHGADAFETHLERIGVDPLAVARPSTV